MEMLKENVLVEEQQSSKRKVLTVNKSIEEVSRSDNLTDSQECLVEKVESSQDRVADMFSDPDGEGLEDLFSNL